MEALYAAVVRRFPQPFAYGFAYGSAVKPQAGAKASSKPMVDVVFTVDDPEDWHQRNLQTNASDYSGFARAVGPGRLQARGAGVYFNPLLPLSDHEAMLKYGIVGRSDLLDDLKSWRHLYLAGRLHKPVQPLINPEPILAAALQANLSAALHAALLLLPGTFTDYQLYHTIARLSYSGDFRMIFGENKNKVDNIVKAQMNDFHKLYSSTIESFRQYLHVSDGSYQQNVESSAKYHHLCNLPTRPKEIIFKMNGRRGNMEETLRNVADKHANKVVERALQSIVWNSSVWQSLKGILTAGPYKSLVYSTRKIAKMF